MTLSDQLYILSHALSAQVHSLGVNAPKVSGKAQEITGDSKVERGVISDSGCSSQSPVASEQEIQTSAKQTCSFLFKIKPPQPTPKPVPKSPVNSPPAYKVYFYIRVLVH